MTPDAEPVPGDPPAFARTLLTSPAYQANLTARILAGLAPEMEVLLHHYAFGTPSLLLVMAKDRDTELSSPDFTRYNPFPQD